MIYVDELVNSLAGLFKQAYELGVEDGRKRPFVATKMLKRKDLPEQFGIKVDAFDEYYRGKGFPYYQEGSQRKYYAPAVHEWLMNHQSFNN